MIKAAVAMVIAFGLSCFAWPQKNSVPNNLPRCVDRTDPPIPDHMIRAKYPKDALSTGKAGTVEIRAVVAPDGKTKELTPIQGDPEFRTSALDAVRRWRFHPISKEDRAVETTYKVQVRFNPLLREANSDLEVEYPQPESPRLPSAELSSDNRIPRASELGALPPKVIYQPEPEISEASRIKGDHGNVDIALVVGSDGVPRNLKIICSSVPDSDQNALDAVSQWKFEPATKDGKPLAVSIQVEVAFKQH